MKGKKIRGISLMAGALVAGVLSLFIRPWAEQREFQCSAEWECSKHLWVYQALADVSLFLVAASFVAFLISGVALVAIINDEKKESQ